MSPTNLSALQAAINLLADATKDSISAVASGGNIVAVLFDYQNILPDLVALLPQIGQIPSEAIALQPADFLTLAESLVARLAISNAHAQSVIKVCLKLLNDVVGVVVPDVEALIVAIKG